MAGLTLTRRKGESIMIEDVQVFVEQAHGGRAKIRIVADPAVSIMRTELLESDDSNKDSE